MDSRLQLQQIHKYASCSSECFVFALIYIDRLIQRNNFILTELNVHRVVITAVLLAAKFYDDSYYNNAYYAKVGGVPVTEMNGLELEFLFFIQFSLHATPDVFMRYRHELISHATWTVFDQVLIHPARSQHAQMAFIPSSTSIMCMSNPADMDSSSRDKQYAMEATLALGQEHSWTHQVSPSPPPSATSVSPPSSCDDQDKTEAMLNIETLKYYSAPARYSCLPPGALNNRDRSNSVPLATQHIPSNCVMDRIPCHQQQFGAMDPYIRVVSDDPFQRVNALKHGSIMPVVDSNIMYNTGSRPSRADMARTPSHERCLLSVPISPNTSSPRFVDAIVSSKS